MSEDDVRARLAQAAELIASLPSMSRELERDARESSGTDEAQMRAMLDAYARSVRALRAVAVETRGRVEQAAAVVTDAWKFAHRRRRRANKIAAKLNLQQRSR